MLIHPERLCSSRRLLSITIPLAILLLLTVTFHNSALFSSRSTSLDWPSLGASPLQSIDDEALIATGVPLGNQDDDPHTFLLNRQGDFWKQFHSDLIRHAPQTDPLVHPEDTHLDVFFKEGQERERPNILEMTNDQFNGLKISHNNFVERIHAAPYKLPYAPGTRGIVTTAGGPFMIVALVSIRMLRETGSTLPVEVFLANHEEWDSQVCENIFPTLNAKCLVLSDIFDQDQEHASTKIDKYQYKIMSILFSSFEELLFLDADCFPIYDPEPQFHSPTFMDSGLVLWPDFWYPSESPLFFNISSIPHIPDISRRPSTESGEILYSKRLHDLSILLAAYYNYHGPDFYYPLQSQGAPGEGDKETFLWSAIALGLPLRSVKKEVHALGYNTKAGEWRGSAMAQFDPIEDRTFKLSQALAGAIGDETVKTPRPLFLHVNFPKLDPAHIFDAKSFGASGPTTDSDGTRRRIWADSEAEAVEFFGWDVERRMWSIVVDIACTYEQVFDAWKKESEICARANKYWYAVFEKES